MSRDLIAVLVDDDVNRAANFRAVWTTILKKVFPFVDVRLVQDIDDTDSILKDRPYVMVLDNVFPEKGTRREVPNRGVDFIVRHKPHYPDCVFLLYTGKGFQIDALGNKYPNPDILVTKTALSSTAYQNYIATSILAHLRRYPVRAPTFSDARDAAEIDPFQDHLHSIVEQCLFIVQDRNDDDYVQHVTLTRLGGGYSGSFVFSAKIAGSERYHNLPFVLKIGEGADTTNEVSRYNRFARLQMPHDMRVDLLGAGATGKFSGALYAFAFGKVRGVSSATDRVKDSKFEFLETISRKLFLSDDIGWYKNPKNDVSAEEFYNNSEEYAPAKDGARLDGLRRNADDVFGSSRVTVDEDHYLIDKFRCDHVRRQLRKFYDKSVPEVISHGDFNTNNIILSADGSALSTIDFEYTGYDCVYKDFVSLESSLRGYWSGREFVSDAECWDLCSAESALLAGQSVTAVSSKMPATQSYFECIHDIRSAAKECVLKCGLAFDEDLYALALAFHMLKLTGLRIWNQSAKIKLLACLFAICQKLEQLA